MGFFDLFRSSGNTGSASAQAHSGLDMIVRLHHDDSISARGGAAALRRLAGSQAPSSAKIGTFSMSSSFRNNLDRIAHDEMHKMSWWSPLPAMLRGNVGVDHGVAMLIPAHTLQSWMNLIASDLASIAPSGLKSEWNVSDWEAYGFDSAYDLHDLQSV